MEEKSARRERTEAPATADATSCGPEGDGREALGDVAGVGHDQASTPTEEVEEEFDALLFGVQRSIRYHMRRQGFFDTVMVFLSTTALVSASVTVLVRVAWPESPWVLIVASASAIAQGVALALAPNRKAREHNDLARRFSALEQQLVLAEQTDAGALRRFRVARLAIEADEPPIARVLDAICHNDLCRSLGREGGMVPISRFQRWTAHFQSEYRSAAQQGA